MNRLLPILGLATAYFLTGQLAYLLKSSLGYPSLIWPASGIALAGILIYGYRAWPGILLGAVFINGMHTTTPIFFSGNLSSLTVVLIISSGASLQAIAGAYLVRRYAGFPNAPNRQREIALFFVFGGLLSALINSTLSMATLVGFGLVPSAAFLAQWGDWYLGDALGIVIFGPLTLAWLLKTQPGWERRRGEITLPVLLMSVIFFYELRHSENYTNIIQITGLVLTSWVMMFSLLNSGRKHLLEMQVNERTAKLNEIKNRFRATFESAPVGVITISPGGRFLDVNKSYCDFLGYSHDELQTMRFDQLTHPDDHRHDLANFELCLSGVSSGFTVENRYIHKNGMQIWGRLTVKLIYQSNGLPDYFIEIIEDITWRKQAEDDLRKANALQSAIFNSANFSSIATDANGIIQIFNVGAEKMLGYSAVEVLNIMTPAELSDANELIRRAKSLSLEHEIVITPGFEALIFKAERGIEDIYELTYIRKDGSRFPAVVSVTALRADGLIIGYLLIGTDNTARKQAQDIARKLLLAVEQNPTVIAITDLNAKIEYVNEQFVKSSGYSREEVIGKNSRFLQSGKTPETTYIDMWTTLVKGNNWQGEFINKSKQGIEYLESALMSPIRDSNGEITHYLAIKEDITERRQNEAIVLLAKERAEELAISKTQFLANMSHEIRTPMNGIIGFSELALIKEMSADIRDYLIKINGASINLLGILNDILDLSKLEANGITLNLMLFDLDELRDTLYSLFAESALNKGLVFDLQIPAQVPRKLIGDDLRLKQVLINLLSNAIKFTNSGAVNLSISLLDSDASKVRLLFSVKDTGIGLSSKDQKKIFQPFSQADDSISRRFGGTGLGLALSNKLVQLMGGEFTVVSTQGLGSCFSFELVLGWSIAPPLVKIEPYVTTANALKECSPMLTGRRILVAEDNFNNQEIVRQLLTLAGVQVEVANNGMEVLKILEFNKFDAILMDVQMPIMGGLEATQRIRRLLGFADIPVIALTAGVTESERQQCLASGMNEFVTKPINMALLLSVLVQQLNKKGAGMAMRRIGDVIS